LVFHIDLVVTETSIEIPCMGIDATGNRIAGDSEYLLPDPAQASSTRKKIAFHLYGYLGLNPVIFCLAPI
jgi:hypothetical protein